MPSLSISSNQLATKQQRPVTIVGWRMRFSQRMLEFMRTIGDLQMLGVEGGCLRPFLETDDVIFVDPDLTAQQNDVVLARMR
jgi:hypothetical protein